jgi:hypothetical protein
MPVELTHLRCAEAADASAVERGIRLLAQLSDKALHVRDVDHEHSGRKKAFSEVEVNGSVRRSA